MNQNIISKRPYFIRAIYEWCCDLEFTAHMLTHVDQNTIVPLEYVQNSQIILNICPTAAINLDIGNEWITFKASFNSITYDIAVPIKNVLAIFAQENGEGMQFNDEILPDPEPIKKSSGLKLL